MTGYSKEEEFELKVLYRGQEMVLPCRLVQMGYTYKFFITVDEQTVIFEPDEERNLRAVIEDMQAKKSISVELVRAIGEALEKELR